MKAKLRYDKALRFIGTNERGLVTEFDTTVQGGGLDSAASPMEAVLEAAAACTSMDIVSILQKKRKTIQEFTVDLSGERAETHPKVFTSIEMDIRLLSSDATLKDLTSAIELSHSKYCSVSIMLQRSGCALTWKATLQNPDSGATQYMTRAEYIKANPEGAPIAA